MPLPPPPQRTTQPDESSQLQGMIPADAGIRAPTTVDYIRRAQDVVGKPIAALLGLDYNQMAESEASGLKFAMTPGGMPRIPSLQPMLERGFVRPASNTFSGGFFLDESGNAYQLTNKTVNPGGPTAGALTHEQALLESGLMPTQSKFGYSPIATALDEHKLVRMRTDANRMGIEMGRAPSQDQLFHIMDQMVKYPKRDIMLDLYKQGDVLSKYYKYADEALKDLFKFYGLR